MEIFDLVGVGFGPSNLALGIAIEEFNQDTEQPLNAIFFENSSEFRWHKDMLIPGATVQISFIKDLVTLRNPTSEFSFLNYLKCNDRILKFANLKTFNPTRLEFYGYFKWAAEKLPDIVRYGKKVIEIRPFGEEEGEVNVWEVLHQDLSTGKIDSVLCRNVAIATGGVPRLPKGIEAHDSKIWHSSKFLNNIKRFDPTKEYDFCVAGGGQSAAEIVEYLYKEFPKANVHSIFSAFGFKPADESSFVNEIFDPSVVDMFFNATKSRREALHEEHSNTNYKVVDIDLIERLYELHYQELVSGKQRLFLRRLTTVREAKVEDDRVSVDLNDIHNGDTEKLSVDALVLATGYTRDIPVNILGSIKNELIYKNGLPSIDRHFRLETKDHINATIVIQGFSENAHGISDTLLSTLSVRSQDILENVLLTQKSRVAKDKLALDKPKLRSIS